MFLNLFFSGWSKERFGTGKMLTVGFVLKRQKWFCAIVAVLYLKRSTFA